MVSQDLILLNNTISKCLNRSHETVCFYSSARSVSIAKWLWFLPTTLKIYREDSPSAFFCGELSHAKASRAIVYSIAQFSFCFLRKLLLQYILFFPARTAPFETISGMSCCKYEFIWIFYTDAGFLSDLQFCFMFRFRIRNVRATWKCRGSGTTALMYCSDCFLVVIQFCLMFPKPEGF